MSRFSGTDAKTGAPRMVLEFPEEITSSTEKTISINQIPFTVMFGDIFALPDSEFWIPMIPNYPDGVLFRLFMEANRAIDTRFNMQCMTRCAEPALYTSLIPNVPFVILFNYEHIAHKDWHTIFDKCATLCPEKATLVVPAIGCNNNVEFWTCASTIFTAIKQCLSSDTSPTHNLNKIVVMTKNMPSSNRVIFHLFLLMQYQEKLGDCLICMSSKANILFGCGHFVACSGCYNILITTNPRCPLCRVSISIHDAFICNKIEDCSAIQCCGNPHSGKIFVPCGCFNGSCETCAAVGICPTCKKEGRSIKIY